MRSTVTILGHTLQVRTEADLAPVAADIERRLREVSSKFRSPDPYLSALIVALNLAAELRQLRQEIDAELLAADRDLAALSALLDPESSTQGEGT